MTLQELIGELNALALAYPPETQVYVMSDERADSLEAIEVVSDSHVEIHLKG